MAEFDLAVIGAGAAGLAVAAPAARLGLRVLLVERARIGGDCLNSACMPGQALLAAAAVARRAREAARFGLRVSAPEIDWPSVVGRAGATIASLRPNNAASRFRALGATVREGEARFVAPDAIMVDGRRLTARRFVIAAGSRPAVPPVPGLEGVPHLTSATLFATPGPPGHLLVLGGAPIGLEMAAAHAALGWQVSVIAAGRVLQHEDAELAAGLRKALVGQGIGLIEGVAVAAVEPGPALLLGDGRRIAGTHLLLASGRSPNLESLGLEAGGIRATPRGITTDRGLRSLSNRRVFAVGDIADPTSLGPRYGTHVGNYHAAIVIRRAVFRLPARLEYAALPRVLFTEPELAAVGLTEAEARRAGHDFRLLRSPLAENDRAITEQAACGLVKLVTTRHGRLLGAGILSRSAGDMIGVFTLAIGRRLNISALAAMLVPYPTRSAAGTRAAGEFILRSLFSGKARRLARFLTRLP